MKQAKRAIVYLLAATAVLPISTATVVGQKKPSNKELEAEVAKWKQAAEEATARATRAEVIAVQMQKAAEISQAKAEKAEAAASRARYIAQAKAMALKSTELSAYPEQQALVAMLAYKFNTTNGGNPYDNDIYNGLRQALVSVKGESVQNLVAGNARVLNSSGAAVYSGGSDGMILRWTKSDSGWISERIVDARKNSSVFAMEASPDGAFIAVAEGQSSESKNHSLVIYDLRNPKTPAKRIPGFSRIKSIAYTPQGDRAYVFEADGKSIKLTDFKGVREVIKPTEQINVAALSIDGNSLAGGGSSGKVYLWNAQDNFRESILYQGQSEVVAITFAPDNARILIGDSQGRIMINTIRSSIPPRVLVGHVGPVTNLVFNNAGTFVASVADEGIRIWNWSRQSDPPLVLKHDKKNRPLTAVFSPDDQQILVVDPEKTKGSIIGWPTKMSTMSESLCSHVSRNMSREEWDNFAGADLPYQKTCENLPNNNK